MIIQKITKADIKKLKKINWKIISKKGSNFEILLISIVGRGLIACNNQSNKKFGPLYTNYYRQFKTHRDILNKDAIKFLREAKKYYKNDLNKIYRSFLDYKKILNQVKIFSNNINKLNFDKINDKKLISLLKKYKIIMGKTMWYGYNYYFYQFLGNELYSKIAQKTSNSNKISEYFEILSQANKLSVIQQELKDLLFIVHQIDKNKLKLNSIKVNNLINKHLKKYAYMGLYYFRGSSWQPNDIRVRLRHWLKQNYQLELKKIKILEKNNKNWLAIVKSLNFNAKEKLLVKTLKTMSYCTNNFDEVWNYAIYNSQNLLLKVSKKIGVSYQLMIEMDINEIIELLIAKKKVSINFKKEIKQRQQDSLFLITNKQTYILTDQELIKYEKYVKLESGKKNISKKFKGEVASIGKVKGRVKIVSGIDDLKKVNLGDIMVAKATVPSFVPAMEKAIGIVTELGGLLSHAAIVSREMRKPCVVGIDDVTELLKDGDLVEVDAEKGYVTIIK